MHTGSFPVTYPSRSLQARYRLAAPGRCNAAVTPGANVAGALVKALAGTDGHLHEGETHVKRNHHTLAYVYYSAELSLFA
jgi:hypothetical protein